MIGDLSPNINAPTRSELEDVIAAVRNEAITVPEPRASQLMGGPPTGDELRRQMFDPDATPGDEQPPTE